MIYSFSLFCDYKNVLFGCQNVSLIVTKKEWCYVIADGCPVEFKRFLRTCPNHHHSVDSVGSQKRSSTRPHHRCLRKFSTFPQKSNLQKCCSWPPLLLSPALPLPPPFTELKGILYIFNASSTQIFFSTNKYHKYHISRGSSLPGRLQAVGQSAQQPRQLTPARRARASPTRWPGPSPPRCSTPRSSASSTAPSTAEAVLTPSMGWQTTSMSLESLSSQR